LGLRHGLHAVIARSYFLLDRLLHWDLGICRGLPEQAEQHTDQKEKADYLRHNHCILGQTGK